LKEIFGTKVFINIGFFFKITLKVLSNKGKSPKLKPNGVSQKSIIRQHWLGQVATHKGHGSQYHYRPTFDQSFWLIHI
jgi:hypothetical protein